jgi:hypothetical protein
MEALAGAHDGDVQMIDTSIVRVHHEKAAVQDRRSLASFFARRRVSETLSSVDKPMPSTPAPASVEPAEPLVAHRIQVQVAPRTENDPGAIIEGSYTLTEDGVLRVYDADQNLLGTECLKLGEDPARAARQLLRKKQGNGFDRRIEYPNLGIV